MVDENDCLKLKRQHKYFTQCQMGITGINKCYFIVWTPHGMHVEIILFDNTFFEQLRDDFYVRWP